MSAETKATSPAASQPRLVRWYVGTGVMLFNTLLLFLLLNLALWPILAIHTRMARPDYLKYPDSWYRKVYPTMADADWKELVRETKDRPYKPEPYVMFTEPAYHDRYLNISEQGYRFVQQQGPWPMDPKNYNVWTFGGSTMFGYGVSDDQTVAANLQTILQTAQSRRVCVYNFGRRAYDSTLERILYEQLLQSGAKPDLVVFLDGLNDFEALDPGFLPQMKQEAITSITNGARVLQLLQSLPAAQMTRMLLHRFILQPPPQPNPDWEAADQRAIDGYMWNKKAIEAIDKSEGITNLFVFQPTPTYEYDLSNHILKIEDWDLPSDQYSLHGYPIMAKFIKDHDMGSDFIWLADMQLGIHRELYVDKWHYSPELSHMVAAEIAKPLGTNEK